ncbi:hypothetical protein ACFLZ7_00195 [Nanoarchaeota archaeon]
MSDEKIDEAIEELKRADHLIYVSLKYTRTCDIIKHVIERLIACSDIVFDYLLEKAKDENKIDELPIAPTAKAETLKKVYADNEIMRDYFEFYLFMRKLSRAKFTRRQEYRRHVTMTCILEPEVVEVKIDSVEEYNHKVKEFIEYIQEGLEPEE